MGENKDVGSEKRRHMAEEDWQRMWDTGRPGFHKKDVHHLLSKHIDKVLVGRSGLKWFFPLCGKSVDMKWLYDLGHHIVGVEFCEQGIQEFFAEQQLEYTASPCEAVNGSCYQTADGRLKVYKCDIHSFSNAIEGTFDVIWDRGAMVAVNKADRPKYTNLIISLMAKECRMLMVTLEYNPALYPGPPHCIPEYEIYNVFEDKCEIERLEFFSDMQDTQRRWGLDCFYEKLHLLVTKD